MEKIHQIIKSIFIFFSYYINRYTNIYHNKKIIFMYQENWKLKNKFTICLSDSDIKKLQHMANVKEQNPSSYLRCLLKNDYDKNAK